MPIIPQQSAMTTEERFDKVIQAISNIRSSTDQSTIRNFILDICKRYIEKDKELQQYVSPSIKAMNAFESEYIERILKQMFPDITFL